MKLKPQLICFTILWLFLLCGPSFTMAEEQPPVGQVKSSPSASNSIPQGQVIPQGQTKGKPVSDEGIRADIFGDQGGRFHPFLIAESVYTDNLYSTKDRTKEDFISTIQPGIWLAFPANRARLIKMDTTPTAPGGLRLSRIKPEATRRYQTYFLYSPQFVLYLKQLQSGPY